MRWLNVALATGISWAVAYSQAFEPAGQLAYRLGWIVAHLA
jgi:hypothetical protein